MSVEAALVAAGFVGVERERAVVFARDGAAGGEFTAEVTGAGLRLALRFAVRASEAERAAWMRAHPAGRLDIVAGETELSVVLPEGADVAAGLALWRGLMQEAARAAVGWRRGQKPLHGM